MNQLTKQPLKLYVWSDVLSDYSGGIAFALATDVREAKRLLIKAGVPENRWKGTKLDGTQARVCKTKNAFYCWGGG